MIRLQDGMTMQLERPRDKAMIFEYESHSESTLILRSNSTLKVDITCPVLVKKGTPIATEPNAYRDK